MEDLSMDTDQDKQQFIPFIKEFLDSRNFDWFVTLKYDSKKFRPPTKERIEWEELWAETDPEGKEGWIRTPRSGHECFEQWLQQIQQPSPRWPGVESYLWLEEDQGDGVVAFHVLIADWNGHSDTWRDRWREMSGGWSNTREVDERLIGLFGHLVMRKQCPLYVNLGLPDRFGVRKLFNLDPEQLYTHEDFIPWRPKEE
jgi:hypothetical protein